MPRLRQKCSWAVVCILGGGAAQWGPVLVALVVKLSFSESALKAPLGRRRRSSCTEAVGFGVSLFFPGAAAARGARGEGRGEGGRRRDDATNSCGASSTPVGPRHTHTHTHTHVVVRNN